MALPTEVGAVAGGEEVEEEEAEVSAEEVDTEVEVGEGMAAGEDENSRIASRF